MTIEIDAEADVERDIELGMGRLETDLGSTLGVLLISLGTRSGLWAALAGAGPLTAAQVAEKVDVDRSLVREWLRGQAAGGYLDYDADADTFRLGEGMRGVLVDGPGGAIVEACVEMLSSMVDGFADFAEAFGGGQGFGWHQRTVQHWHGTDLFTRTALPPELIGAALAGVSGVHETLTSGGRVVDVGCGYGAPTTAIARLYPHADVVGIDYHDASIMHARSVAAADAIGNLRFEVCPAGDLADSGATLITFFDSLHDMGDPLGALLAARRAVAADGAVVLVEPPGGDHVSDNLNPGGRMFYAVSTLVCTPNAVSQRTDTSSEPLGALAGIRALTDLAQRAGFSSVQQIDIGAPMNLILQLRP
ncbi:class I SAM-dependent methyltransferase [Gordonia sp. NPDC003424]